MKYKHNIWYLVGGKTIFFLSIKINLKQLKKKNFQILFISKKPALIVKRFEPFEQF